MLAAFGWGVSQLLSNRLPSTTTLDEHEVTWLRATLDLPLSRRVEAALTAEPPRFANLAAGIRKSHNPSGGLAVPVPRKDVLGLHRRGMWGPGFQPSRGSNKQLTGVFWMSTRGQ